MAEIPDPGTLVARIEADALALDEASKQLEGIQAELVDATIAYQDEEDVRLAEIEAEYQQRNDKLPSERQRLAHARPRIDRDVRRRYHELETQRKLVREWADIRGKALSARQSELRALRAEADAPEPSWSRH